MKLFLAQYAYPSDEILAAAKIEGYTFDNLKEAKTELKTEGLQNTNQGSFRGKWWSGFGRPDGWTLRPEPAPLSPSTPLSPLSPQTPRSGQCGESGGREETLEAGELSPHRSPAPNGDGRSVPVGSEVLL